MTEHRSAIQALRLAHFDNEQSATWPSHYLPQILRWRALIAELRADLSAKLDEGVYTHRRMLLESSAVQYSLLARRGDTETLRRSIEALVLRNPEHVLSAALRLRDGTILVSAGDHARHWAHSADERSPLTHPRVPIYRGKERWGTLEVSFAESSQSLLERLSGNPAVQFLAFVAVAGFLVYMLYMRRTLTYLDPSAVIPERVRAAFDALSDGILLLDDKERVILANSAFSRITGNRGDITGRSPSIFAWQGIECADRCPWTATIRTGEPQQHVPMTLSDADGTMHKLIVTTTPVGETGGTLRGVLVSFDDVTALDAANAHLLSVVQELEASRQEVARKNEELVRLATRDPLTGCLNRRAFFESIDTLFAEAHASGRALGCIMTDIDHFKSFNDRYGHAVGDQVIRVVAKTLAAGLRADDLLCRYGGEEFCIVLPDTDITQAAEVAERIRAEIETNAGAAIRTSDGVRITSSFGISALAFGAADPAALIDQADAALYASKQSGRNRATRWDHLQSAQQTDGKLKAVG